MAGYSATPLARKLGIKAGSKMLLVNPPKHYQSLVAPLPEGVTASTRITAEIDIVHLFTIARAELTSVLEASLPKLRADAAIWVSWPKRASKVPTDITEDVIREVAFPLGLVDIKVCAVDEVWSGLKLVIRKTNRN